MTILICVTDTVVCLESKLAFLLEAILGSALTLRFLQRVRILTLESPGYPIRYRLYCVMMKPLLLHSLRLFLICRLMKTTSLIISGSTAIDIQYYTV